MFDPVSSRTGGYHLFIEPIGALQERCSHIINALATECGSPAFVPHITLLARIPATNEETLIARTRTLAAELTPFDLTLGVLGMEDVYFRALYMNVDANLPLRACRERASDLFELPSEAEYRPHLSLLYGNFPNEQKRTLAESLSVPVGSTISVDRVHLYKTEGEAHAWRKVGEYPFGVEN